MKRERTWSAAGSALCGMWLVACAGCGDPAASASGAGSGAGAASSGTGGTGATNPRPPIPARSGVPVYGYRVVNSHPHDRTAFTQGLLFHAGHLYESTGQVGESSVRRVELATGVVLEKRDIASMFAEGLALVGDRLVQLTWKDNTIFQWNVDTLESVGIKSLPGEGWGLTYDGTRLIKSDGSSRLTFLDPVTLQPTGHVLVRDGEKAVPQLNELEWIDGHVFANVWMTDRIAKIDASTGRVVAWVDLTGIIDLPPDPPNLPGNVLNGIAHDPATGRIWVTGKDWPTLFEIELVPPPE
jgi:glutamine cyclotransferase